MKSFVRKQDYPPFHAKTHNFRFDWIILRIITSSQINSNSPLPIDLWWYKYGPKKHFKHCVVGICNLPFGKLIFAFAVSHISRIVEEEDKIVRTFRRLLLAERRDTTQRSFYSDTFTGRLLVFSVVEFSPVRSRLVGVSTLDRELARYWNWRNFKRRVGGVQWK